MISDKELKRIKQVSGPVFSKHRVNKAYLFGSRARGDNEPDSDYDFYCEIDRGSGPFGMVALQALMSELEPALGGASHIIDAPYIDVTYPEFFKELERDKVVVYERKKY